MKKWWTSSTNMSMTRRTPIIIYTHLNLISTYRKGKVHCFTLCITTLKYEEIKEKANWKSRMHHLAAVSTDRALQIFYDSDVCRMLHDKELGLHLMSDTYIVNDLIEELSGKQ